EHPRVGSLNVLIRNVGVGPAVNVKVGAEWKGSSDDARTIEVTTMSVEAIAIDTGVPVALPFQVRPGSVPLGVDEPNADSFVLSVTCQDRQRRVIDDVLLI